MWMRWISLCQPRCAQCIKFINFLVILCELANHGWHTIATATRAFIIFAQNSMHEFRMLAHLPINIYLNLFVLYSSDVVRNTVALGALLFACAATADDDDDHHRRHSFRCVGVCANLFLMRLNVATLFYGQGFQLIARIIMYVHPTKVVLINATTSTNDKRERKTRREITNETEIFILILRSSGVKWESAPRYQNRLPRLTIRRLRTSSFRLVCNNNNPLFVGFRSNSSRIPNEMKDGNYMILFFE